MVSHIKSIHDDETNWIFSCELRDLDYWIIAEKFDEVGAIKYSIFLY